MTDQNMLKLAANAAGIEWSDDECHGWTYADGLWTTWNPLADDGDAFRLAVKLGIDLSSRVGIGCTAQFHEISAREPVEMADANAAMRRAVVRVAAGIGATIRA